MIYLDFLRGVLADLLAQGGWVVGVLLVMSVLALGVSLWKLWQFRALGVGRHRRLAEALALWDRDARTEAEALARQSASHLAPTVRAAMELARRGGVPAAGRLEAEAAAGLARLEGGFRLLDAVAQMAPLVGLFGTVLGMIQAFQALQDAGSAVDPSILAGGIWVALLTTAVGLAVAMPTALALTWFESRVARERVIADRLIQVLLAPGQGGATVAERGHERAPVRHAHAV